ncbi:hypothetical protein M441DRAFT_32170 [Trichoderma asperellum CBS 433.97]|uniref:Uncharacterized protein n=1 Tax=Trichoderma asperellum (strain ATCC 204424 / CBS 433.97 / NBRC 101777) TaxID=1042311 RepID=A0A2T3YRL2_TRIA4|nr:hypothetical protein M441DRAFT_32170 [Trichoderma asperellum CBS 433.97]PTB35159.1 hypothetical protein M441DRAFT_32170 [Trichoderma asperellum CBS 433.97]
MASNDINTCARRISQHLDTYNAIKSDINDLRAQIIESSGPDKQNLEAVLQIRTQEKTDEARAAINTQIQMLNLVVGSGWTRIPFNIRTALNRIFSGDGLAELRERFELGRDLAISDNGELAGPNPNALTLLSRQTRAQTRAAVRRPLTEISANIVLDTPAPKRPRLNAPEVVPPTPAAIPANAFSLPESPSIGPRRSSRLSSVQKVNYSITLDDAAREDSPDDVESEGSFKDDMLDIDDIDDMFDDLEDADLEEDGPSTATRSVPETAKCTPFTDENGLLRIGPQPKAPAMYIKWVPRKKAIFRIKNNSRHAYKRVDRKIKQLASIDHESELAAI